MTLELCANAATKIEPFLLLAKTAKGAAAAKLIENVTAAPGVFNFGELLELASIQGLEKTSNAPHLHLLQLFAYGTFSDYLNSKDSLPPLNEKQLTKLRLLTIISHSMERRVLPYALLLPSIQVPTIRELEDLIIDGIYLDLMRGKLDQKAQQFEVEYTIGRDLGPGKVQTLREALQEWAQTASSVLSTLDSQLSSIREQEAANKASQEEQDRIIQDTLADIGEKLKEKSRSGGRSGGDEMDVDIDAPRLGTFSTGGGLLSPPEKASRKLKVNAGEKAVSRKRNKF